MNNGVPMKFILQVTQTGNTAMNNGVPMKFHVVSDTNY